MSPGEYPSGGRASIFPLIIASKRRAAFEYRRLDVGIRLRIRARQHVKGVAMSPLRPDDAEAVEWITGQAEKYGIVKWTRQGWVKEKFQKGNTGS